MTETQVSLSRARSADEYREILFSNLEEYERLARMVADMLYLAKADNGLMVPHREQVGLGREVRELAEFFEPLASERGVAISQEGSVSAQADRLMMRRAIANLLSNAIRHASGGKGVKVELGRRGGDQVFVRVENQGTPIAPEHLPRLFDRFYRVDPARARESEGVGLGLAITRSIAAAHGGELSVRSDEAGTAFEILLPTA